MNKIQIYLAGPYSHPDKKVQEKRFYELTKMAGWIMKQGYTILSPITHGHPIAATTDLSTDYKFWKKMCELQMNACKILAVYKLEGWETSIGISNEILYARKTGVPVMRFDNKHDFKKQIKNELDGLNDN